MVVLKSSIKAHLPLPPNEAYLSRALVGGDGGVLNRGRLFNFNSQLEATRLNDPFDTFLFLHFSVTALAKRGCSPNFNKNSTSADKNPTD